RDARLPAADAAARGAARAWADGGDRRRRRARRPALGGRDVRGVPLRQARHERGARRARPPRREPRRVPGRGRAADRAAHPGGLGGEERLRAVPADDVRARAPPRHVPSAGEAPPGEAVRPGFGPRRRARRDARGLRRVESCRYWFPISCIILNIGRYIAMTMMPTMNPTPIIISGSMMDVRDWIVLSTSSS